MSDARVIARRRALSIALLGALLVPFSSVQAQESHGGSPLHEMAWGRTTFVLAEVLDFVPGEDARPLLYDLLAWSGGSTHRLWLKAEGSLATVGQGSSGAYQALYGRMISPYWDAQIGARLDLRSARDTTRSRAGSRVGVVVGVQGVAPGWFELEPALFVSSEGKVAAEFKASYDLYFTQRLVLQPRLEAAASLQDDPDFGTAAGLTNGSLALRARWEVRREFAPYVGVLWERQFGGTAALSRAAGDSPRETLLVVGVRLWR